MSFIENLGKGILTAAAISPFGLAVTSTAAAIAGVGSLVGCGSSSETTPVNDTADVVKPSPACDKYAFRIDGYIKSPMREAIHAQCVAASNVSEGFTSCLKDALDMTNSEWPKLLYQRFNSCWTAYVPKQWNNIQTIQDPQ